MKAEELVERFAMGAHIENGAFVEKHYLHTGEGRAASGSIYYCVGQEERTEFHRIDCDEYWCYTCGSALEIWIIGTDGTLCVKRLGIDEDCEPMVYMPRGAVFASRHAHGASEGTFVTCVTVPRFTYEGFEMLDRFQTVARCPEADAFWK